VVVMGPEASDVVLGPISEVVVVKPSPSPVPPGAVDATWTWLVTTIVAGTGVAIGPAGTEVWAGTMLLVTGGTVLAEGDVVVTVAGAVVDDAVVDDAGPVVVEVAAVVVAADGAASVVVVVDLLSRGRPVVGVAVCLGVVVVVALVVVVTGAGPVEVVVAEVVVGPGEDALGTASASLEGADLPLPSTAETTK
jgi:hypothetical protein